MRGLMAPRAAGAAGEPRLDSTEALQHLPRRDRYTKNTCLCVYMRPLHKNCMFVHVHTPEGASGGGPVSKKFWA